jgi:hypothetical protein
MTASMISTVITEPSDRDLLAESRNRLDLQIPENGNEQVNPLSTLQSTRSRIDFLP